VKRVLALSFLFWTLAAVAFTSQAWILLDRAFPWTTMFVWTLAHAWAWAVLTPIVFLAGSTRSISSMVIAVIVAAAAQPLIQFGSMRLLQGIGIPPVFRMASLEQMILGKAHVNLAIAAAVAALSAGLDIRRRSRERELQNAKLESLLARAELEAVRARFQPHFLFNALNSAASLVDSDPPTAKRMIVRFANLLRASLRLSSAEWITLGEELRQTEGYLEIERIRFGDRLSIVMNIDPALTDALIPPLILQPVVENAVKHGASRREGRTTITLTAAKREAELLVEISDRGDALSGSVLSGIGEGMRHIESRLRLVYGSAYEFHLVRERSVTTARLAIPLRFPKREAVG
jgi:sensor histidine kinase YesM